MRLEHVGACPICQNTNFENHLTAKDYLVTQNEFTVRRCVECSFLITSPRPNETEISYYYQSSEYISHSDKSESIQDAIYKTVRNFAIRQKIKLVEKHNQAGTILDYGTGTGTFPSSMEPARWARVAVEPSAEAQKKIPKEIEVHTRKETITQSFDAITLWHVLEHVHPLNETLKWLQQHLSANGTMFIAVPNPQSKDAQVYHSYWAAYDVPRHLWHFNKTNMHQLLKNNGLKVIDIKPMYFDAFYVSLLSEQHLKPQQPFGLRALKALVRGLQSNMLAGEDNYSSLIYIAKHD